MRVVLLTSYHYPVASIAVQTFLKNTLLKKHNINVVGIVATPIWKANKQGWHQLIKFFKQTGWKFASRSMMTSVTQSLMTFVARQVIPNKFREIFEIEELAAKYGIRYLQAEDINSQEVKDFCRNLQPDLFVSALLLQRVKKEMLDLQNKAVSTFIPPLCKNTAELSLVSGP